MQRPELSEYQRQLLDLIEIQLKKWKIPRQNRPKRSTGNGRSVPFGFIRRRSYVPDFATHNTHRPKLWNLFKAFGKTIGISWKSVQVNQNCVCSPHRDIGNRGISYLVSLGDYTGGELVVEDEVFDCNRKPIIFNGATQTHWNKDILSGDKWTLVFFDPEIPKRFAGSFPEGWDQKPEFLAQFEPDLSLIPLQLPDTF